MPNARRFAVLTAIAVLAAAPVVAQRGDDANRRSKNGHAEGTSGGAQVTIEYGRPLVAGRAIFGSLVPYGAIWRTGADEATTVTFDRDVEVEGQPLAAGTYALFTIPNQGSWTVIFNRVAKQWGAFKYEAGEDALRVDVKPRAHELVEALEFAIEGNAVVLRWETTEVSIRITSTG